MVRKTILCLLLALFPFAGCSLIFNTVKVEVPEAYQGWCYVIPVKDTAGFPFNRTPKGRYKVNEAGIAYVPAQYIRSGKDLWVRVYQQDKNITKKTRYLSRINSTNTTSKQHHFYVHFFVPGTKERDIPSTDPYWQQDDLRQYGISRFDSLLDAGAILFK
ncbi:hypothetical protein [uncultured Chitinophaga sp.]|jgi:hypothetical protein|uniref:hypothetical protein n=1 Tax=uncultured Chitinophaga sp. TaxID=339340 RepID=UPI00262F25BB|nr:hypothetical protein [uncultured Chitinophaga sp.]